MGIGIDTNVLIRYFTLDDTNLAQRAKKIIDTASPASLLLDRVILAELSYVLKSNYGFKKAEVGPVFLWLLNSPVFTVLDRDLTALTVELYLSEAPLSFEDCWLLAMKRSGKVSDVATFDADLQKRLA